MAYAKHKKSSAPEPFTPEKTRETYQPYIREASLAFIKGTKCRTPDEAIRKGKRTLKQWLDIVERYRYDPQYRANYAIDETDGDE